ncbi:nuclear transport factor 2 family protein [Lacibacterium aquatile]|uniref:Nuclear transport factor 2 family protein n=1 Tax=Lacibacterium aquatile TaxID=1168082 RepID=A0ABW5DLC5_9PROT
MLNAWADFWQNLTPDRISRVRALCTSDVRFVDPFNDLVGVERMEAMLQHMFAALDTPRFVVIDRAMGEKAGYLRWEFTCRWSGNATSINGMSEVSFAANGQVVSHRDHWDSGEQVYGRVPLLGSVIKLVKKRLSLPSS